MEQGFPHCDLFDSVFVCVIVKKGFPILISSTAFAGPTKPPPPRTYVIVERPHVNYLLDTHPLNFNLLKGQKMVYGRCFIIKD